MYDNKISVDKVIIILWGFRGTYLSIHMAIPGLVWWLTSVIPELERIISVKVQGQPRRQSEIIQMKTVLVFQDARDYEMTPSHQLDYH